MDPLIQTELKSLRKRLYTYHNRLLDMDQQSRIEFEIGIAKLKRPKLDNESSVDAFESCENTPLQNEYILEMISAYLPSQGLRNCRLVCRLWNKEMSRSLSARQTLIVTESNLGANPEVVSILGNAKKSCVVAVKSICFFDIAPTCQLYKKLMARFGCTLSVLKLEECQITAQDLANILTRHAPHLESFSYKDRALPESQRTSTFVKIKSFVSNPSLVLHELKRLYWNEEFGKVELEEIVAMCPNLIELVYKNIPIPATPNYETLRFDSLRTLKISPRDELRNEHVISLTSLKLNLTRLTIFGVNPKEKETMKNLNKFLKSISSTLTDLELFQHYTIEARFNPLYESPLFVNLPHLTRLNVDFCILKSVKTFSSWPQLKSFECKAKVFTDWEDVVRKGFPGENHNVDCLNLGSIDDKYLSQFARFFSSCTYLELEPENVTDEAMRVIIRGFPRLRQFRIAKLVNPSKLPLTDLGVTGLNLSTCKRLSASGEKISDDNLSKEKTFPALYDLKELARLEIHADESFLTDISVVHGIAKCSKLHILELPECDITDVSLKAIQDNLKLTILDLPKMSNFSVAALTAIRNKHKDMILQSGVLGFFSTAGPS